MVLIAVEFVTALEDLTESAICNVMWEPQDVVRNVVLKQS